MDRKWRVLSSETLVKDRWIDLRADRCLSPEGREISPYYVLDYPDWVHVVALTPDDRVVLVRQYRHGAGAFFLEPPGGIVDVADRDAEVAGRRELLEETGYGARHWQGVGVFHANPATQTNRVHVFLAKNAAPAGDRALDAGEEGLTVHLLPVSDVLAGLAGGLIGQSLHVSALLLGLAAAGRISLAPR